MVVQILLGAKQNAEITTFILQSCAGASKCIATLDEGTQNPFIAEFSIFEPGADFIH